MSEALSCASNGWDVVSNEQTAWGASVVVFLCFFVFFSVWCGYLISSNPHGRIPMGTLLAPKSQLAGLYTLVRRQSLY